MCGIAGFCNDRLDRREIITAMTERMRHRGPDAEGFWMDTQSGWTLGHRRLSIMDLSQNGVQPMHSASGRFVISYNGEIYNAQEIKKKLLKDGYVTHLRGTSDTEILLEAMEAYGIETVLSLCKGMFAFALYDKKERVFYLARDRMGEKPLYYGLLQDKNGFPFFAFASDCALFHCIPGFQGKINRDALAQYMLYKYVPAPLSIYEGIYKLPPGTILSLKTPFLDPSVKAYWSLTDIAVYGETHPFSGSYEEAKDELERLLASAIKDQMVADVPVGAFLSGGIDSPLVVSLMQKMSDKPVKTFTIGYDDPKVNEAQYAKEIAGILGTDHRELYLTEKEMKAVIPELPYYFTEPLGDSSLISTYFVSKLAKSEVTVSLSGDGGDELFCGYERYWGSGELWRKVNTVPYTLRNMVGSFINKGPISEVPFFYKAGGCLQAANINQIREMIQYRRIYPAQHIVVGGKIMEMKDVQAKLTDIYGAMQIADMEYCFPDDILYKVDRASMSVSLESRIPMLDRDFLEFAWTLPSKYKYSEKVSKRILRDILYKYVPREMLERPKQGFWVPIKKWLLEGETYEYATEIFQNCRLVRDNYLDKRIVSQVWEYFQKTKKYEQLVFNILIAEQWYRNQKEKVK